MKPLLQEKKIEGSWKPGPKHRCEGKIGFYSAKRAEASAENMSRKLEEWLVAYDCYTCGMFHVGHASPTEIAILEKEAARRKPNPPKLHKMNRKRK